MPDTQPTDYDQPVAYDKDGRPLYAHPPTVAAVEQPQQVVHVSRAFDPVEPEISAELAKRHDEAAAKYPALNLSKAEYIISEVRRHPIGLLPPLLGGGFLAFLVFAGLTAYPVLVPSGASDACATGPDFDRSWYIYSGVGLPEQQVFLDKRKCHTRNPDKSICPQ